MIAYLFIARKSHSSEDGRAVENNFAVRICGGNCHFFSFEVHSNAFFLSNICYVEISVGASGKWYGLQSLAILRGRRTLRPSVPTSGSGTINVSKSQFSGNFFGADDADL